MRFKSVKLEPGIRRIRKQFRWFPIQLENKLETITIWLETIHIIQEYTYKYPNIKSGPYWKDLNYLLLPKKFNTKTLLKMLSSNDPNDRHLAEEIITKYQI